MQSEVTGTGGFESQLGLLANLSHGDRHAAVIDLRLVLYISTTTMVNTGSSYLEWGAGTLDLDVTPAGRVPATDGQVTGQVLVSYCLSINSCDFGLHQNQTKGFLFP